MVRIDQQNNILRNIFKLQDELKDIDEDEGNACLSMTLQRSQLKSAIHKKINVQKVKYYSLAKDREFMDTLTEDHYEKEMRFYEHIIPKNCTFNNTTQHLFEKLMKQNDTSGFHEHDDDSFQFQEMALNYLESTSKKIIGNVILKNNFTSIFDDQPSSLMIKPKENIATDSGKILDTESNKIMNVDSEKILESIDENKIKKVRKKHSNVLNRRKFLRKHVEKHGTKLIISRKKHLGKIVSYTYPRVEALTVKRKKTKHSTVINPKELHETVNMKSEKIIELPSNDDTGCNAVTSDVPILGRAVDVNEQTEEKKRKTLTTDKSNIDISQNIVQFNEVSEQIEQKHNTIRSLQNILEFTLFNQGNFPKNDLNLKIISNQKLENNCFNLSEVLSTPPKVNALKPNYNENLQNHDSVSFCNDNSIQKTGQPSTSQTFDTENSTISFHTHTTYHPTQHATITHKFFDESTILDSDISNIPINNERNIYKLGDIAEIIVEFTLRRTQELYQNLNKKQQNGNLIMENEALYIKHMLSLLQNVHSEIFENTECLLKQKSIRDIPCDLIKYISDQNRKILDMINTEQELLKQILNKLYN